MYANLVVGISGLAADRDAVALAKALAARDGVLTLVNVRLVGTVPAKGSTGAYEASESEHSYELLQCQRQAYAKEADVVSVAAVTVGAGLHHVAENLAADLIVVGGCHRGPVGRVLAGDDARAALHHAPCAVAVAPRGHGKRAAPIRTIGVAYDGSEPGEVALAHSALLAMELGAKLRVREIVELRVYGAAGLASAAAMIDDPDAVAAAAREHMGEVPGAEIEVVVGAALLELTNLTDEVDLMVCGSRQQGPAKRVLLGSTSDHLARHAHSPLLVTPRSDEKHVAAWHELRDAATV
jgi:nucleotide-binding universal stress UspA family protein